MRNLGQTKCKRCHRWYYECTRGDCIPDAQWQELVDYAAREGRCWKSRLSEEWMQGKNTLRWARNHFGPSGLLKVRLSARAHQRR